MEYLFANNTHWETIIGILHILVLVPTTIHALLHKNDVRAAIGWIGLILLSPLLGSALYWMFGINRIKARAKTTRDKKKKNKTPLFPAHAHAHENELSEKWQTLMRAGYAIHDAPYLAGNHIRTLINGDEAYPRMLAAISEATSDIVLSSYIFDCDATGRKFIDALGAARARGVAVHVLVDGVLLAHRWRKTERELRKQGVETSRFFSFSPRFINLRNHRKILCIDGRVAFIGGLNIRQANMTLEDPLRPVQDVHFEVTGPVIDQIGKTFVDDWYYATGDMLALSPWNGTCDGPVTARALPDGPDENHQKLEWTLHSAINCAERHVRIVTPYFIPDHTIIKALQAASLRGVDVEIIVPAKNNILFFNWAMQSYYKELLQFNLKIYESAPPFDHSKLMMVDDTWSLIGSANWDARSLALNFEINLECYDPELNATLRRIFDKKKSNAKLVSKDLCNRYPLPVQIRNNFVRLLSPYL